MNKKHCYLGYGNKSISNTSKKKYFNIPPLAANWKCGNAYYDEIWSKIKKRTSELEDWVRIHQPKVYLLGDSHSRHLADILTEMLSGFKIEASVKPGVNSKRILSNLEDVMQYTGENDFIVTICGTNDMWNETLEEPKSAVCNALKDVRYTNLLLCNVPRNYLEPRHSRVHDNIINFNKFYQNVIISKKAHLVNLYELVDRNFFTRHGLHFNLRGKIKICDLISNKIIDIINLIET